MQEKINTDEFLNDTFELLFASQIERTFFNKVLKVDEINKKYFNDRFTIDEIINMAIQI